MKHLDLRAVQAPVVGTVTLFDDGKQHEVRAADGNVFAIMRGEDTPIAKLDKSYDAIALIVPSLSPEEVRRLRPEVVAQIIVFSMDGIDEVEQTNPNGEAPANPSPA